MIAEIAVMPVGTGGTSMRTCVDAALEGIRGAGVDYRVHELGTSVEGSLEQILQAFKAAHDACVRAGVGRVRATLRLDDRRDQPEHLDRAPGAEAAARRGGSPRDETARLVDRLEALPSDALRGIVRTVVPQLLRSMPLEERAGYLRDLIDEIEGSLHGRAPYDVRPDAPSHTPLE